MCSIRSIPVGRRYDRPPTSPPAGPPLLSAAYFDALTALPGIAVASLSENPDRESVIVAMAAIAVASHQVGLAEITLEMSGVADADNLEWLLDR